ncbi:MAG: DNA-formamidopyrimidine glycosylase family protein [Actinomycetota bacterium]
MPEGHTTHALARRLNLAFAGSPVGVSSPQGKFAGGAAILDGLALVDASAWGKHLFAEFGGGRWLNVHLGLIGKFSVLPRLAPQGERPVPVVGQVRLRLLNAAWVGDLRGPTVCAVVTAEQVEQIQARLGPDPLRPDSDGDQSDLALRRISRSARPIAELLMDQAVLAGVGNVYRCEVLFRHRVDPFRPGREIRPTTWRAIWDDLVVLMPLGVAFGQVLTMDDQVADALAEVDDGSAAAQTAVVSGARPGDHFERRFYLYRRTGEPCRACGSRVRTQLVAGRNLFWCGRCQRRR